MDKEIYGKNPLLEDLKAIKAVDSLTAKLLKDVGKAQEGKLLCRIKKPGKTRGRPTNWEKKMSEVLSQWLKDNQPAFTQHFKNIVMGDDSVLKMDTDGKLTCFTLNESGGKQ